MAIVLNEKKDFETLGIHIQCIWMQTADNPEWFLPFIVKSAHYVQ